MSENEKYRLYLFDLGLLIKEKALQLKEHAGGEKSDDRRFQRGILFGYAEVINLMQQQARAFGIDLAELRLEDIEPEGDLI